MNDAMRRNEEAILKKIEEFKDSMYGLDQDIKGAFYSYSSEEGYQYNDEKAKVLIEAIFKHCDKENELFFNMMPLFLEICLKFLFIACNTDDWTYLSIVKLSKTLENENPEWKSTMDILIEDEQDALTRTFGKEFHETYQRLREMSVSKDLSAFPTYVKDALKGYLMENEMSYMVYDRLVARMVHQLNTMINEIYWDYRFNIEAREHEKWEK